MAFRDMYIPIANVAQWNAVQDWCLSKGYAWTRYIHDDGGPRRMPYNHQRYIRCCSDGILHYGNKIATAKEYGAECVLITELDRRRFKDE